MKSLNLPIAVIANASMLNSSLVRDNLQLADWVSIKIDTGDEAIWRKLNRPITALNFDIYLTSLLKFSQEYKGKLANETMLVKGLNDATGALQKTAGLVSMVNPTIAYISIPTRPPAINTVTPPDENVITEAYHIFSDNMLNVELILGFEGTGTGFTGNATEDILNICAVHPIREDTMHELLRKNNTGPSVLKDLLNNKLIQKIIYKSNSFYLRKFQTAIENNSISF